MKTAISIPDATFARVEAEAERLGVSRSQFFARAAERWLAEIEADGTTEAINRALEGDHQEEELTFARAAAASLTRSSR